MICALFVLFAVLGVLQYRWIGEVSRAERDRTRGSLQASLERLGQDFNSGIVSACRALMPAEPPRDTASAEAEVVARYAQWRAATAQAFLFSRIALASPGEDGQPALHMLDPNTGAFAPAAWPAGWENARDRIEFRLSPASWRDRRALRPFRADPQPIIELPLLGTFAPRPSEGIFGPRPSAPAPFPRQPQWLIVELDLHTVRENVLPELIRRHLGAGVTSNFFVQVLTRSDPPAIIYQSDPGQTGAIAERADASAGLFEPRFDELFRRRAGRGVSDLGPGPAAIRRAGPDSGRWEISVVHRAGSLDAAVARTRRRNLAVTAGVFLLMVASLLALIRFTRRAQRLAELQMEFVAGVSHELRTPLTVIHTAAYNLTGKVAANPGQVERYGSLIQKESARLKELVEQVLQFAGSGAGRIINGTEPVPVESIVRSAIESSGGAAEGYTLETSIDAGLPPVLADRRALEQALRNLISNAMKYGASGTRWIGVSASALNSNGHTSVAIRVADHGPGIPHHEQQRIFDPFYRGRRAVQDQVHGTGLGLTLVKRIVEAHGGTIHVASSPHTGAEFTITIPAAPPEPPA